MKRLLSLTVTLVLLLSLGSAFAEGKTLAFLPPAMISPYYASCIAGAKPAAEELGYELLVVAPNSESDYAAQVQIAEDMIARGVDGIILCAINTDAIVTAVKKANDANIPVVMFNVQNELAGGKVDCYVTYDQRAGGAKVADYMAQVVGDKETNVAVIEGLPSTHTTERMGGFCDRIAEAYPNIHFVGSQPGNWEREAGMNAAANMMQALDIDAFFGLCDEMSLGAAQAIKQAGGKQLVFSFDGNPNAAEAVKNGDLVSTLAIGGVQTGEQCVRMIDKVIKGETLDKFFKIDTFIVDKNNVDDYLKTFN
jgi:ribose transport system substrate-binding protein